MAKVYCEPDNNEDLSDRDSASLYKFRINGINPETLNILGWIMQNIPYKKVRTLICCGVYYKYQVEYGPSACYEFMQDVYKTSSRILELLPTGDSAPSPGMPFEPQGYGSYMDRKMVNSVTREFISFVNVHTGKTMPLGLPVPKFTAKRQLVDICVFDPAGEDNRQKTLLNSDSLEDGYDGIKRRRTQPGSLGAEFLGANKESQNRRMIYNVMYNMLAGNELYWIFVRLPEQLDTNKKIWDLQYTTMGKLPNNSNRYANKYSNAILCEHNNKEMILIFRNGKFYIFILHRINWHFINSYRQYQDLNKINTLAALRSFLLKNKEFSIDVGEIDETENFTWNEPTEGLEETILLTNLSIMHFKDAYSQRKNPNYFLYDSKVSVGTTFPIDFVLMIIKEAGRIPMVKIPNSLKSPMYLGAPGTTYSTEVIISSQDDKVTDFFRQNGTPDIFGRYIKAGINVFVKDEKYALFLITETQNKVFYKNWVVAKTYVYNKRGGMQSKIIYDDEIIMSSANLKSSNNFNAFEDNSIWYYCTNQNGPKTVTPFPCRKEWGTSRFQFNFSGEEIRTIPQNNGNIPQTGNRKNNRPGLPANSGDAEEEDSDDEEQAQQMKIMEDQNRHKKYGNLHDFFNLNGFQKTFLRILLHNWKENETLKKLNAYFSEKMAAWGIQISDELDDTKFNFDCFQYNLGISPIKMYDIKKSQVTSQVLDTTRTKYNYLYEFHSSRNIRANEKICNDMNGYYFQAASIDPKLPDFYTFIQSILYVLHYQMMTDHYINIPYKKNLISWYYIRFNTVDALIDYIISCLQDQKLQYNLKSTENTSARKLVSYLHNYRVGVNDENFVFDSIHKSLIATCLNVNVIAVSPSKDLHLSKDCSAFLLESAVAYQPLLCITLPTDWKFDPSESKNPMEYGGRKTYLDFNKVHLCICPDNPQVDKSHLLMTEESDFFGSLAFYKCFNSASIARDKFKDVMRMLFEQFYNANYWGNSNTVRANTSYNLDTYFMLHPYMEKQALRKKPNFQPNESCQKLATALFEIIQYHDKELRDIYLPWVSKKIWNMLDQSNGPELKKIFDVFMNLPNSEIEKLIKQEVFGVFNRRITLFNNITKHDTVQPSELALIKDANFMVKMYVKIVKLSPEIFLTKPDDQVNDFIEMTGQHISACLNANKGEHLDHLQIPYVEDAVELTSLFFRSLHDIYEQTKQDRKLKNIRNRNILNLEDIGTYNDRVFNFVKDWNLLEHLHVYIKKLFEEANYQHLVILFFTTKAILKKFNYTRSKPEEMSKLVSVLIDNIRNILRRHDHLSPSEKSVIKTAYEILEKSIPSAIALIQTDRSFNSINIEISNFVAENGATISALSNQYTQKEGVATLGAKFTDRKWKDEIGDKVIEWEKLNVTFKWFIYLMYIDSPEFTPSPMAINVCCEVWNLSITVFNEDADENDELHVFETENNVGAKKKWVFGSSDEKNIVLLKSGGNFCVLHNTRLNQLVDGTDTLEKNLLAIQFPKPSQLNIRTSEWLNIYQFFFAMVPNFEELLEKQFDKLSDEHKIQLMKSMIPVEQHSIYESDWLRSWQVYFVNYRFKRIFDVRNPLSISSAELHLIMDFFSRIANIRIVILSFLCVQETNDCYGQSFILKSDKNVNENHVFGDDGKPLVFFHKHLDKFSNIWCSQTTANELLYIVTDGEMGDVYVPVYPKAKTFTSIDEIKRNVTGDISLPPMRTGSQFLGVKKVPDVEADLNAYKARIPRKVVDAFTIPILDVSNISNDVVKFAYSPEDRSAMEDMYGQNCAKFRPLIQIEKTSNEMVKKVQSTKQFISFDFSVKWDYFKVYDRKSERKFTIAQIPSDFYHDNDQIDKSRARLEPRHKFMDKTDTTEVIFDSVRRVLQHLLKENDPSLFISTDQHSWFVKYSEGENRIFYTYFQRPEDLPGNPYKFTYESILNPDNLNYFVMKQFVEYYLEAIEEDKKYAQTRTILNPELLKLCEEVMEKWPSQMKKDWDDIYKWDYMPYTKENVERDVKLMCYIYNIEICCVTPFGAFGKGCNSLLINDTKFKPEELWQTGQTKKFSNWSKDLQWVRVIKTGEAIPDPLKIHIWNDKNYLSDTYLSDTNIPDQEFARGAPQWRPVLPVITEVQNEEEYIEENENDGSGGAGGGGADGSDDDDEDDDFRFEESHLSGVNMNGCVLFQIFKKFPRGYTSYYQWRAAHREYADQVFRHIGRWNDFLQWLERNPLWQRHGKKKNPKYSNEDRHDDGGYGGGGGKGGGNGGGKSGKGGGKGKKMSRQQGHDEKYANAEFDQGDNINHLGIPALTYPEEYKEYKLPSEEKSDQVSTYAQGKQKELHLLTSCLAQMIFCVKILRRDGWITLKIHGGQSEESRKMATIIRPFFERAEIYPISKAYTNHMVFAGIGFRRKEAVKYQLYERLRGCASLNTSVLNEMEKTVRGLEIIKKEDFDVFARKVERTSQKMFMDWYDHNLAISRAYVQATLYGEVSPSPGYLSPEVAELLNKLVFRRVPEVDRKKNLYTLDTLMQTPFGEQLKPFFIFVPEPRNTMVSSKFEEEYD